MDQLRKYIILLDLMRILNIYSLCLGLSWILGEFEINIVIKVIAVLLICIIAPILAD